jgi:hypothetical protein
VLSFNKSNVAKYGKSSPSCNISVVSIPPSVTNSASFNRAHKASFDIVYRDKTKAGAETTLLIIEFKDKAIAYVNGRALISFDNPPEDSIGIFIMARAISAFAISRWPV